MWKFWKNWKSKSSKENETVEGKNKKDKNDNSKQSKLEFQKNNENIENDDNRENYVLQPKGAEVYNSKTDTFYNVGSTEYDERDSYFYFKDKNNQNTTTSEKNLYAADSSVYSSNSSQNRSVYDENNRYNTLSQIVESNKDLNSKTIELMTDVVDRGDTDVFFIKKIIKKVWTTSKATNTQKIQTSHTSNSNDWQNGTIKYDYNSNKSITNEFNDSQNLEYLKLEDKIKITFKELNAKYKQCWKELKQLINSVKKSKVSNFEYSEDRLKDENEKQLLKLKYDFKNNTHNDKNLTEQRLDELMLEFSRQLDVEREKIKIISIKLENHLQSNVEQSNLEKNNVEKLQKKGRKKLFLIILMILAILVVSAIIVILVLEFAFKIDVLPFI